MRKLARFDRPIEHAKKAADRLAPRLSRRIAMERYFARYVIPRGAVGRNSSDHLGPDVVGDAGIALHEEEQVARLTAWKDYGDLYRLLRSNASLNRLGDSNAVLNDWYETPDVEIYASMICDTRPEHIIEVGVGHSTIAARMAINWGSTETKLIAVDRHARTAVEGAADVIVPEYLEDVRWSEPPFPPLSEPVMLFIDSSHIVRSGGDIPILFNQLIPRLAPGSTVHVHDVFIPWDYPNRYRRRLYTEQYVLQALLCCSSRFRTIFAAHYMSRTHTPLMQTIISRKIGDRSGASYWFAVD